MNTIPKDREYYARMRTLKRVNRTITEILEAKLKERPDFHGRIGVRVQGGADVLYETEETRRPE